MAQAEQTRLVVKETVYHQVQGKQPKSSETKFARMLRTKEQPYYRSTEVDQFWVKLDLGWVKSPWMVIVRNAVGKDRQVNPTPEERSADAAKILELAYVVGGAAPVAMTLVRPGCGERITPAPQVEIWIRCQGGEASIEVEAYAGS